MMYIKGYLFGLLVFIPLGALIAQISAKFVGGIKVPYLKALISTFAGYAIINVLGFIAWSIPGTEISKHRAIALLISLLSLALAHVYLLKSEKKEGVSAGKAFIISAIQIFGQILIIGLIGIALRSLLTKNGA